MQTSNPSNINDKTFMKKALDLAVKALGRTSPNPLVGCVIVKNAQIVGEGYHHKAGTPHAEVHALEAAGEQAREATAVSYTHLRAHETRHDLVCRLLLE